MPPLFDTELQASLCRLSQDVAGIRMRLDEVVSAWQFITGFSHFSLFKVYLPVCFSPKHSQVNRLECRLSEIDLHYQSPRYRSIFLHGDVWSLYRYIHLTKTVGLTTYFYRITSFFQQNGLNSPLVHSTNHSMWLLCHFLAWCIKSSDSHCRLAYTVDCPRIYSMTFFCTPSEFCRQFSPFSFQWLALWWYIVETYTSETYLQVGLRNLSFSEFWGFF